MARNISGEIDLDTELAIEGSKSGVWTLPQVEHTHNLYPNFRFTIEIVFTIIEVSIKYRDS